MRKLLAALLGVAAAALPAVASSETNPTVNANVKPGSSGGIYGPEYEWSPSHTTAVAGGAVTFATNTPDVPHGIVWSSAVKPACDKSVPVDGESASNWSGACRFAQPGTYSYYCAVHGLAMSGTVTVAAGSTTTTQSTPPGGATNPSTTTPVTPGESGPQPASGSPLQGSVSKAVALASSQHGKSVRGAVKVSHAGAGGRLVVELLARSAASLARTGHQAAGVRVGRLVRSSLHAGTVSFTVALSARAKRALARHRRLALTVKLAIRPVHGAAVTVTRGVVLHA
jgi:plastocyanin